MVAPVWNIIYSFGLLMGIGGSVLFSTIRGKAEGQEKRSNAYFTASVIGSIFLAAVIWLVVIFFDRELLLLFGAEGRDQDFALPIPGFLRSHLTCKKKSVTIDRLARRANHSVEMMGWIRHRLKCLTLSSLFYLEGGEYEWTF